MARASTACMCPFPHSCCTEPARLAQEGRNEKDSMQRRHVLMQHTWGLNSAVGGTKLPHKVRLAVSPLPVAAAAAARCCRHATRLAGA